MLDLDGFLNRCVFVDLELHADRRLGRLGAVCGQAVFERGGRPAVRAALDELDRFATDAGARWLAGHNVLRHDWPAIRRIAPDLALLRLPVVDTLLLSPLAFPENPYHALVKDYKLVKDSVNDPVADSRLAARLFRDQWQAFAELAAHGEPDVLNWYRYCLHGDIPSPDGAVHTDGLVAVLELMGARPLDNTTAQAVFGRLTVERVCSMAAGKMDVAMVTRRERAALAYALAWLRVAGGNSVLPPWVRGTFPEAAALLRRLREIPCGDPACGYCGRVHDVCGQLQRHFGFAAFRPTPAAADGSSLQEAIARRGIGDQPLLAILPTGGGKSLCYQLPALVRHERRGVLTVILSPLQALMKDQVDNFAAKTGSSAAAAVNGLLTPPERGDVLERVRLGTVSLLYVSPEQLRNKSTVQAIKQREIGCWVFDEAHCLSKWGHDFRPDYLYAARFIRELAGEQGVEPPPVACFTATAKRDVTEEIIAHFRQELGQELELFEGGIERENLNFEVQQTEPVAKFSRVHELLDERLGEEGCAVVYVATRKTAENLAEYLIRQGWQAAAFHAGLSPPDKRRIQDEFVGGELRVICATNAFGMGIDKDDVRMVVHADMPGSLENYLQEAGRAGRDRQPAQCVLLYDQQDVETQFALNAISQLTPRDIRQILRGLRRAKRKSELLVITSGELLRDEEVETSFDSGDNMADTKVKTAVAWLERANFLERNQNATYVFSGKPQVRSLEEAEQKIDRLGLPPDQRRQWLEILQRLINTEGPEGISADSLAELPAFYATRGDARPSERDPAGDTQRVLRTLDEMSRAGLMREGLQLSAYVRYQIHDSSQDRLRAAAAVESALLQVMEEQSPEAEEHGWLAMSLRRLNQTLTDQGLPSNPELIRRLLTSLSMDGRGFAASRASLEFRHSQGDHYRVKLHRDWQAVREISQKRRDVAAVVLQAILSQIPAGTKAAADLLVEFSSEDLTRAVESDLTLRGQIKDVLAAVDRGLMYLHEQGAIILQNGLSIFRQAMTIRLLPEAKGRRYTKGDFTPLESHYKERVLQVHVMYEYARRGVQSIKDGLQLVLSYFGEPRTDFLDKYFGDRLEVLDRAVTHESYQRIVDDLQHPEQQAIVAAPADGNALVLAGPGSGKTRVIVHRVGFLVNVLRIPPQQVLVLCFNRLAAIQLKRRLRELIGSAGTRVTVLTYHALAARLTGTSFADRAGGANADGDRSPDLASLIPAATKILRGEQPVVGLAEDEVRERLLAGYRYVLVDEYQDIDEEQYQLISAVTDRTGRDSETKLAILAVGDDDQNIYAFRGANVAYIRRFQEDYRARGHFLLENYRSTAHILAAANQLIAHNRDRMKTGQAIRINKTRQPQPAGGAWETLDPVGRGKVQVLELTEGQNEAAAVVAELQRLHSSKTNLDWSDCAVLARTRDALQPIRAACEHLQIPVIWGLEGDRLPRLSRIREFARFLETWNGRRDQDCRASGLSQALVETAAENNPWHELLKSLLAQWQDETDDRLLPVAEAIDFIYDSLAEQRREQRVGRGVFLATVHAAKGTEFDHVLVPGTGWTGAADRARQEEERRLYYVAMTRARQTLTLFADGFGRHPHVRLLRGEFLRQRSAPASAVVPHEVLARRYELLGLDDVHLGFAGARFEQHPIHAGLAGLEPGSPLQFVVHGEQVELADARGRPVARLSQAACRRWKDRLPMVRQIRVVALVQRRQIDEQAEFRQRCRCDRWEVPLAEVIWMPGS